MVVMMMTFNSHKVPRRNNFFHKYWYEYFQNPEQQIRPIKGFGAKIPVANEKTCGTCWLSDQDDDDQDDHDDDVDDEDDVQDEDGKHLAL